MNFHSELTKFKAISFFSGMIFTLSFLTPFYLSKGLTAYQILLMQSVFLGVIMLLEIPSGAFSDLFGRKLTLSLAFLSFTIAWLMLFLAHDFVTLLPYQVAFAIGVSLKSGTYSAYIYELCHLGGTQIDYGQTMAQIDRMWLLAAALSAFSSSLLYHYGGFILVLCLTALCAALAFIFVVALKPLQDRSEKAAKPTFLAMFKRGVMELKSSRFIAIAALNAIIGAVFIGSFFHFNQLILKHSGFPVSLNGLFMGTVFLTSSFVMKRISGRRKWLDDTKKSLIAINLAMALIIVAILLLSKHLSVAPFLLIFLLSYHVRTMFSNKMLNESISDGSRATTLSYVSFVQSLGAMLLAPIYGKLYDGAGGLLYIVIIVVSMVAVNLFLLNQLSDRQSSTDQ